MYIKLIFKREVWNVPGCNAGYIDALYTPPVVVEKLRDDEKPGCYMPVRSLLHATKPDVWCYYADCHEMSKADIKNALSLFSSFYDFENKGMPSVLSGVAPEQNEIIANLHIAIGNAVSPYQEWRQFMSGNGIGSVDEMVNKLMC